MVRREGLSEEDKQQLKEEVVKLGFTTLREAKKRAPVDTGRLRASITLADNTGLLQGVGSEAQVDDSVDKPNREFSVVVGTNVDYADFIEFGTVKQPAHPFLRPAKNVALQKRGFET